MILSLTSSAPISTTNLSLISTSSTLSHYYYKPFLNLPKLANKTPKKPFPPRAQESPDEKESGEKKNGRPRLNLRWLDLVLDPDPDNVVAVGLTGVLVWASARVLWQLFFISLSILVAALKYSFIAALLVFILITLL